LYQNFSQKVEIDLQLSIKGIRDYLGYDAWGNMLNLRKPVF